MDESYIRKLSNIKVLIVGDLMLDTFYYGDVYRISPEAPVPVLSNCRRQQVPGGAANVAVNCASIGVSTKLIGIIADDIAGETLSKILSENRKISASLIIDSEGVTTEKIRYTSAGHHLLRIDNEGSNELCAVIEQDLIAKLERAIPDCNVVVLSDYMKGCLTDKVIAEVMTLAKRENKKVLVDPKKKDFCEYLRPYLIKPNSIEAKNALQLDKWTEEKITQESRDMLKTVAENVLVTQASHGMILLESNGKQTKINSEAVEVSDVSGAGDTVMAILASNVAAGLTLLDSALVANKAASIVVKKKGTASLTYQEFSEIILTV